MTIDPDQIRAEIDALLARLPEPGDAGKTREPGGRAVARGARGDSAPSFRGARRAAAGAGVGGEGLSARMSRRARVDAELVRRGLARSRQQAAELIGAGKVSIDGMPALKPGTAVAVTAALTVTDDGERSWVSRGAHKLIGALDAFGIPSRAAAAWTPARRRVGSPRFCWTVGPPRWLPWMSGTASWRGRCAAIRGWSSSSGPTPVTCPARRSAGRST